jgi:hypothetical protein
MDFSEGGAGMRGNNFAIKGMGGILAALLVLSLAAGCITDEPKEEGETHHFIPISLARAIDEQLGPIDTSHPVGGPLSHLGNNLRGQVNMDTVLAYLRLVEDTSLKGMAAAKQGAIESLSSAVLQSPLEPASVDNNPCTQDLDNDGNPDYTDPCLGRGNEINCELIGGRSFKILYSDCRWKDLDYRRYRVSATGTKALNPSVAVDGNDNFIVTWQDDRSGNFDIYARRYDSAGAALGNEFRVDQDAGTGSSAQPAIATDLDDNFIITWQDNRLGNWDIYARRYDSFGAALGNEFRLDQGPGNSDAEFPAIASLATPSVCVEEGPDPDFVCSTLPVGDDVADAAPNCVLPGGDGVCDTVADPADVQLIPVGQSIQSIPYRNEAIITWQDNRNGDWDIYARHFGREGLPLGDSFRVDQAAGANAEHPDIGAYTGAANQSKIADNRYFIAWEDNRNGNKDIFARAFNGLDVAIINDSRADQDPGGAEAQSPSVAFTLPIMGFPLGFVVMWEDYRNVNADIYGSAYDLDGADIALDVPQVTGGQNSQSPRLAASAATAIMVMNDDRDLNFNVYALQAAEFRVDQEPATAGTQSPNVALDGSDNSIIVWADARIGGGRWNIYARIFDSSSNPLPALPDEFRVDQAPAKVPEFLSDTTANIPTDATVAASTAYWNIAGSATYHYGVGGVDEQAIEITYNRLRFDLQDFEQAIFHQLWDLDNASLILDGQRLVYQVLQPDGTPARGSTGLPDGMDIFDVRVEVDDDGELTAEAPGQYDLRLAVDWEDGLVLLQKDDAVLPRLPHQLPTPWELPMPAACIGSGVCWLLTFYDQAHLWNDGLGTGCQVQVENVDAATRTFDITIPDWMASPCPGIEPGTGFEF